MNNCTPFALFEEFVSEMTPFPLGEKPYSPTARHQAVEQKFLWITNSTAGVCRKEILKTV